MREKTPSNKTRIEYGEIYKKKIAGERIYTTPGICVEKTGVQFINEKKNKRTGIDKMKHRLFQDNKKKKFKKKYPTHNSYTSE